MSYIKEYYDLEEEVRHILYEIGAIENKLDDGDYETRTYDAYKYEIEEVVKIVMEKLPNSDEKAIEKIVKSLMSETL